jgi:CDP-diacylglycerol--glycerol-3-phosphate 3-phosphatidyltransferase
VLNIPNSISLVRLAGVPIVLYLLSGENDTSRWVAFYLFLAICATDWLDGYLARKLDAVTELGKFLDPLIDKIAILVPMLTFIERQQIPAWGVALILVRELGIAGWRVNQTQVSGANWWGKIKTVSQMAAVALLILPPSFAISNVTPIVFRLSVFLTLLSGAIYLIPSDDSK